jgi:hypothetical protein
MKKCIRRLTSTRTKTLFVATALVASLAALSVAAPALATPTGEFVVFAECQYNNPEMSACLTGKTESGYFTIGNRKVPIVNPVKLQGGFIENVPNVQKFVGATKESETLTKAAQPVPGGLLNIVAPEFLNKEQKEKFEEAINKGPTGVNATVELAAPATSIYFNETFLEIEEGPALILPVKVHLENAAFLGSSCYIGSNSNPLIIELTTGASGTVKGKLGRPEFIENEEILRISHNSLVNQTFSAPGATGCGLFKAVEKIVDEAVNAELGLPAGSGKNTAVLEGTLYQTGAETVREH